MWNKIRKPLSFVVFALSAVLGLSTFFFGLDNLIHTVAIAGAVCALYLFQEEYRFMRFMTLIIVLAGLFTVAGYSFPELFSLLFAR